MEVSTCFEDSGGTVCGNLSIMSSNRFCTLIQAGVMPPDSNTISAGAAGVTGAIGVSLFLAAFAAARVFLPPRPILPIKTSVEGERALTQRKLLKTKKRRNNRGTCKDNFSFVQ